MNMGKFPNVDKSMGPEAACAFRYGARRMKSTGEAIYFITDMKEEPAPGFDEGFFWWCPGRVVCTRSGK